MQKLDTGKWPASHPAYFKPRAQRPPPQLDGTSSLLGRDVEKKKKKSN